MNKTIILILAGILTTPVFSQEITSLSPTSQSTSNQTHIFDFDQGFINIDARIHSQYDFTDFLTLNYKSVNIFFCDFDQVQDFYLVLKSYAEATPLPKIKVNGTWSIHVSGNKFVIGDAARNSAKLNKGHLNYIIECIEAINLYNE